VLGTRSFSASSPGFALAGSHTPATTMKKHGFSPSVSSLFSIRG